MTCNDSLATSKPTVLHIYLATEVSYAEGKPSCALIAARYKSN